MRGYVSLEWRLWCFRRSGAKSKMVLKNPLDTSKSFLDTVTFRLQINDLTFQIMDLQSGKSLYFKHNLLKHAVISQKAGGDPHSL